MKTLFFLMMIMMGFWIFNACETVTIKPFPPVHVDTTVTISYKDTIAPLFDPRCTGCHNSSSSPASLDMRKANSYNSLISNHYVVPNSPNTSPLISQINSGHQTTTQISAAEKALIIAWINKGAPNN